MADEVVLVDEKLAETVREFPILYDKSLKDFKDRNKKNLAWSDVANTVGFASGKLQKLLFCCEVFLHFSVYEVLNHELTINVLIGKDAEKAFKNLRNRYSRDKKKLQGAKVSGTDTKSVNEVKSETSDMFAYLAWLDDYIKPRRSSSNMVASASDECSNIDEDEDTDHKTDVSLDSDCISEPAAIKSKTTGRTKNIKRSKREDFESAGIELIKSIGNKIDQKKETEKDKDEETIFSELIGTQLKKMPMHDRLMAKMEINQTMYKFMMKNASEYSCPNFEGPIATMPPLNQFPRPFTPNQPHQPVKAMATPVNHPLLVTAPLEPFSRMTSTPDAQFQQPTRVMTPPINETQHLFERDTSGKESNSELLYPRGFFFEELRRAKQQ